MNARRHKERWLRDFTALVVAFLAAAAVLFGFQAGSQGVPPRGVSDSLSVAGDGGVGGNFSVGGHLRVGGAIMPGGDAGTSGLCLQSNGAAGPNVWGSCGGGGLDGGPITTSNLTVAGDAGVDWNIQVGNNLNVINRVGISTATPGFQLQVSTNAAAAERGIWLTQHSDGVHGGVFGYRKSRGTLASPTTVQSGDYGLAMLGQFHDGTGYLITSGLVSRTTGSVTTASVPSELCFFTTGGSDNGDPYGSTLCRLIIAATGGVTLSHSLTGPAGSSSAPTVRGPDADTGIYFPFLGDIYFGINNTARWVMTSNEFHPATDNANDFGRTDRRLRAVYTYALNAASLITATAGIDYATTGSKPTCDSSARGRVWFTESSGGVADLFEVCRKDAADSYAWTALY